LEWQRIVWRHLEEPSGWVGGMGKSTQWGALRLIL
jgi:hypothetical protein